MNVESIEKDMCCGCTGCLSVCPRNAISMRADEEGFLYPQINQSVCIDCGLCVKVCTQKHDIKRGTIKAYAAKNNQETVLKKSSSGGASHALCSEVIRLGGIVYGVAYDNNYYVIISSAETIDECDKFYGSKYVAADPCMTFIGVKQNLIQGKTVLYFATSCVIAGLLSYLKCSNISTENLYTVDLICHGVPSPKIFADYIQWLGKGLKKFDFRTKNKPWGYGSKNFGCTITTKSDKKYIDTVKARVFLQLFFSNNCLRPHCHNCQFCGTDKPADLTIADYWGCKEEEPSFFSESGVSAVLVHSEKGIELLNKANELDLIESSIDKIKKKQGNLQKPSPIASTRAEFWRLYNEKGFVNLAKTYGDYSIKAYIRRSKLLYKYFYK